MYRINPLSKIITISDTRQISKVFAISGFHRSSSQCVKEKLILNELPQEDYTKSNKIKHTNKCLKFSDIKHTNTMNKNEPQNQVLKENLQWLRQHTPVFGIDGNSVQVIHQPTEFYDILKEQARQARRRIVLASLYLGTGDLEKDLVNAIHDSVRHSVAASQPVTVEVLLDFTRGSRGAHNSRTMLLPMMQQFDKHVSVSLYHSPDLRGWVRQVLPERWNEVVGLNHLKVYLFDDNIIMSGANLSDSYFTNRQDRYILLSNCPELADFFHGLVRTVAGLSFRLHADDSVSLPDSLDSHPYEDADGGTRYRAEGKRKIDDLLQSYMVRQSSDSEKLQDSTRLVDNLQTLDTSGILHEKTSASVNDKQNSSAKSAADSGVKNHNLEQTVNTTNVTGRDAVGDSLPQTSAATNTVDTWVCPLVQMAPFSIDMDAMVTREYFRHASKECGIHLGSGYFNLTDDYMNTILTDSKAQFKILSASPEANGFYQGAGISGYIPAAYTHIARSFMERVRLHDQEERIMLYEYSRHGWTFHGKGLWHYLPGEQLPSVSFIGSSNFGYRSVYRDLETNIAVLTENTSLQQRLHAERQALWDQSAQVDLAKLHQPERAVPRWVTYVTALIKRFF